MLDVRARRADLTGAPASVRATSRGARLTAAGCNTWALGFGLRDFGFQLWGSGASGLPV